MGGGARAPPRHRRALLAAVGLAGSAEALRDYLSRINSVGSCSQIRDPEADLEVYRVAGRAALCDMKTDGGGWTLVASGRAPPSDYGGEWFGDLASLQPEVATPYLWYAASLEAPVNDLRFSCAVQRCASPTNCSFAVDLAFYDTPWYRWIARTDVNEYTRRCAARRRCRRHGRRCRCCRRRLCCLCCLGCHHRPLRTCSRVTRPPPRACVSSALRAAGASAARRAIRAGATCSRAAATTSGGRPRRCSSGRRTIATAGAATASSTSATSSWRPRTRTTAPPRGGWSTGCGAAARPSAARTRSASASTSPPTRAGCPKTRRPTSARGSRGCAARRPRSSPRPTLTLGWVRTR